MNQPTVRSTQGLPEFGDPSNLADSAPNSGNGPVYPGRQSLLSPLPVTLVLVLSVAALLTFIALEFVGPLTGPLLGVSDVNMIGYTCYYFMTNLSFTPFPHVEMMTDSIFYPYGINASFQPWTFELNYFYTLMFHLFGNGPWVQWYFLGSLAASALGTYALLKYEYNPLRAAFAGFAAAFACYAVIGKFPIHVTFACANWPLLNLVADHLSLRRYWDGRPLSSRWLLLRGIILLGVFGGDPSYLAGIALSSITLTTAFIVVAWLVRHSRSKGVSFGLGDLLSQVFDSAKAYPRHTAGLFAVLCLFAFLYVPLVAEVLIYTKKVDMTGVPSGAFYASPLRLLVPLFPIYNITKVFGDFHDTPEILFTWNTGIFFVLLILLSVIVGWRSWGIMAPGLLLIFLVLVQHPFHFPVLNYFPWFTFMRHAGRFTMIFPWTALLVSFCIPDRAIKSIEGRICLGIMLAIFGVEMFTAYQIQVEHPEYFTRTYFKPDAEFYKFMDTVKASPGEAVLEFPFCIAGGSGNFVNELGRYYGKQDTIFTLKQFHTKKIVGQYFGRLGPTQVAPFFKAGWDKMFFPDHESPWEATVQRRDFNKREWEFFDQFFKLNDFCGIILYTDLLQPQTVRHFRELYGEPTATTHFSTAGNMIYIPKPASLRGLVNLERGRTVSLQTGPPPIPADGLIDFQLASGTDFLQEGWAGLEADGRWGMGPYASFHCEVPNPGRYRIQLNAATFGKQTVNVEVGGRTVLSFQGDGLGNQFEEHSFEVGPEVLSAEKELKVIFRFPDARTPQSLHMGDDGRVLGCRLKWLKIVAQ